jgi:LPXTG-site transpeptidase (sortase) family protein
MIAQEQHWQLGSSRTASSAVLVVLGLVLLAVPAAGVLASEPTPASGHLTLRAVTRPVGPAAIIDSTAEKSSQPVDPRLLVIDAIGINADVEKIGLTADEVLSTPTDVANVGWYSGSSRPGDMGPAVIVGHVDSVDGPAVFARLAELEVGDVVTVENGGEAALSFAVSTVTRHPKDSFPSEAVYGASLDAELRLITCGGSYDRDSGYADNVVVFARALTS